MNVTNVRYGTVTLINAPATAPTADDLQALSRAMDELSKDAAWVVDPSVKLPEKRKREGAWTPKKARNRKA